MMVCLTASLSYGQDVAPPSKNAKGDTSHPATLTEANDWLRTGQYEQAMAAYRRLQHEPQSALEASLGLAQCQLRLGKDREALAGLEKLSADRSSRWHVLLARVHRQLGHDREALDHARKAVERDGHNATARWLWGQMLEQQGRREEAVEVYRWFNRQLVEHADLPHDAAWVTDTARGFLRYSVLTRTRLVSRTKHVLHEMLQPAYTRLDRTYWPARIASADLLREKYNNDEHDGSVSDYRAALQINPRLPEAFVGLGFVALESWDFDRVESLVKQALAVNPRFRPAFHLWARSQILQRRYEEAAATCDRALAINPNDVEALSLQAAALACRYDEAAVKPLQARVAAINPRSAVWHRTLGVALSGIRQYEASERQLRKAIEYDPTDANARTELGMMYMQWGREGQARDTLEASWALDSFNQRTKFTLDLLASIEKLARHETEHFVVRYDPHADPGLGPVIGRYLETIYQPVTEDFGVTLSSKTTIEVFPTHREFAVRITGQPWIHTVGACTGPVIAIESPRKGPGLMGPYDFSRVLKHEFTHTVTLAATNNRIPHWFTEGLAVAEEDAPRPFEWCRLLADAVRRGSLFTLDSINWAFIRPKRPTDRTAAYAQSEWMCEYLIERFGYDSLFAMLDRYRKGQTQREVFERQFSLSMEQFDQDFQAWAKKQAARWGFDLTPPGDVATLRKELEQDETNAALLGRLARALFDAGEEDAALAVARRSLEANPENRDALQIVVQTLALRIDAASNDRDRKSYEQQIKPALETLLRLDPENWAALRLAAGLALREDREDQAMELLQRLQRSCPMDPTSWRALAGVYLERGWHDRALPQLQQLVRLENNDPEVPARIARLHRRQGRLREAMYWFRRSLFIDPFRQDIHQHLGDTALQAGATKQAFQEYTLLTKLDPHRASYFQQAAWAAHKLGEENKAKELARRAVELDPESPARSLLSLP